MAPVASVMFAAAIAVAPPSSGVKWVPLGSQQTTQARTQQTNPTATAAQPATSAPNVELLTNDTVISLVNAGLGPETIIAKINASKGSYDTSTNGLITLKRAGVPDPVIAAMLNRAKSSVLAGGPADNSNPDPLVPHAPGIYFHDPRSSRMVRIDPTVSNQLKTSNIWGYAFTYGISPMKMKAVIPNASARVRTSSRRPVFYFYFNQSSPLAQLSDFNAGFAATATSPNEFSLVRFDRKNDRREAAVMSVNLGGMKSGVGDKARVSFTYEDVAPGVFKVTPDVELTPGEYGFLYSLGAQAGSTARIFDFSVS
ncbi:MAG TPA: hypothetical protein VFH89_10505 [Sphingomicrobium sp.]|nr:hypothetical protein [Sphingomicrobium sp.]